MNNRGKLDQIEDMNFAVAQIIHKGKDEAQVIQLLENRGASEQQIQDIIAAVANNYPGIRRMEASKNVRFYNYLIDLFFVVITTFFLIIIGQSIVELTKGAFAIIVFVYPFIYYFLPELYSGQTLAKMITGTIVVTKSGALPSAIAVFARTICRLIPFDNISLILSDGILHDRISDTYVVNKKRWLENFKIDNPDIL